MMRVGLWTEMLSSPAALLLVLAAAILRARGLLVLLPILWLASGLARFLPTARRLDEREAAAVLAADRGSLFALLFAVCGVLALPDWVSALHLLNVEWGDAGFVVVAVFYLRGVMLSRKTMDREMAAHLAGGIGTLTLILLVLGTLLVRPGVFPAWTLILPVLAIVPHALLHSSPAAALAQWTAGATLAAAFALGGGFLWIEAFVTILLLALPWTAASIACYELLTERRAAAAL